MIFINPESIPLNEDRVSALEDLTRELCAKNTDERSGFINAKRLESWAHPEVLTALRVPAGNKCWYSEVLLEGGDPNVDHFCPKGSVRGVREVNDEFEQTGDESPGYWWLAFEPRNYRLACMHANQRRIDEDTDGGKWDFFPVRNARATEQTAWDRIKPIEDPLPLDPCSRSDAKLLCFDSDGVPCASERASDRDKERVRLSIWLYHLKKKELQVRRRDFVQNIQKDIRKATTLYKLWAPNSGRENLDAKYQFDTKVAEIIRDISDSAIFAGAKRGAIRLAMAKEENSWIADYIPL